MARRRHISDEEETSYWLSYSDMMAALLLIFVLIISFTMLQARKQYEEKEDELIAQQKIVEEQQKELEEQQKAADAAQKLLEEQQQVMERQQAQLDKIIGVRSNLIEALKVEFSGTDMKVKVDPQTGAITFDSSILFDVNKFDIKPSGKAFLEEFLPRYLGVLLKPGFEEYVSEIIIEGHTDTQGGYMSNLRLSQERAFSVASFCLADNGQVLAREDAESLRDIVTANGRSFSAPIYDSEGNVDMAASRRVEFKFRLKDEDMVDEMVRILNGEE